MRFARKRLTQRLKHRALAIGAAALVLPLAAGVAGSAVASAAPAHTAPSHTAPSGGYDELWVPSSMGNIKVQVQWAARGGNAALYLLDGLRARNDANAWSFETNAMDQYRNDNITLVMPVGGESSFYSDWYAPSNFNGQQITYKWETFLTEELPNFLANYGVSPTNNAVLGLSMGGSAALTLAAYHRDQFKFAGSLSGYLNISAPGMREAIRVAMLDAGLAAQNMMIQATELGLAAHPVAGMVHADMHKVLGLADNLKPVLLLAIGKVAPADTLEGPAYEREIQPRVRHELDDIVLHGKP